MASSHDEAHSEAIWNGLAFSTCSLARATELACPELLVGFLDLVAKDSITRYCTGGNKPTPVGWCRRWRNCQRGHLELRLILQDAIPVSGQTPRHV